MTGTMNPSWPEVTIGRNCQFLGIQGISVGKGTIIGKDSWLNDCVRDGKERISIGKKVLIGRNSMLSSGGHLTIDDYCVLAPNVFISDADHVFRDPEKPILSQGATLGKSVSIGRNCWIGKNACIFGDLHIHSCTVIAANSTVNQTFPGFCVLAGSPARIVSMYSFRTKSWKRTRFPFDIQRLLQERKDFPPPNTADYHKVLDSAGHSLWLDPVLAGSGDMP